MRYILNSIMVLLTLSVVAQNPNFTSQLYKEYAQYKVKEFDARRLKR
ncbi:hypothetical protein [Formosa sediminum]|nr:hypothetical protein [Formosa sediminum]